MQMTEAYAATVAAVVPVLWLVGAVEQHQLARSNAERGREIETVVAENLQKLKSLDPKASIQEIKSAVSNLKVVPGDPEEKLKSIIGWVWTVTTAALLSAEAAAISWLAEPDGKPEKFWAHYCLWTLLVAFLIVGALPIQMYFWKDRRSSSNVRTNLKEFSDYTEVVIARVEERAKEVRALILRAEALGDLEEVERLERELGSEPPC
ncbi:hypothetical protein [Streptomyces sp. NPDC056525]|uniref:hypothetical protein n=1 Tax=unclassified Streptomyces TaxID=2593676 RepID=UPI0036829AA3